ncbi:septum site-determining protein MinC [Lachnospiraceae bacterium LCP25S3_G4]
MDNLVTIKSNKYGLVVHLDPEAPYNLLITEIEHKFKDAAKFFKDAKLAATFEGRVLTNEEEQEVVDIISKTAGINIICIIDNSKTKEELYKSIVEQSLEDIENRDGQFYKGTLRRRQVLESETSVIILGDVELGAKVIAKGNVVVIGSLKGSVHAGASGNKDTFIVALSMQPKQLKIGDIEAKRQLFYSKEDSIMNPKIAIVDGEHIYIDPLT